MSTWHNSLQELRTYIKNNPQIRITSNVMSINSELRPGFYELFDATRMAFINDYFSRELANSIELSNNWHAISEELVAGLNLDSITVIGPVKDLLYDPLLSFMKVLLQPLFDLLKGNIDEEDFEEQAKTDVADHYERKFYLGYRNWSTLAIIKMLQPDALYTVEAIDDQIDTSMVEIGPGATPNQETVPDATKTRTILFENIELCSFLTPRIIVHSQLLDTFVALRPGYYLGHWHSRNLCENQEWYNVKELYRDFGRAYLWPDLGLYTSNDLADLTLVADCYHIARPDVIVDFAEEDSWFENADELLVMRHRDVLLPLAGTFLASRVDLPEPQRNKIEAKLNPPAEEPKESPEAPSGELEENLPAQNAEKEDGLPVTPDAAPESAPKSGITLIHTGYELSAFQPVVSALAAAEPCRD